MDEKKCCKACVFSGQEDDRLFCHFNPPATFLVPGQNRLTGEVSVQVQTLFAVVADEMFCGKWEQRPLGILDS